MANLKLKIKKTLMKRKLEGVTVSGYYGRVITNGKVSFADIARESARNTTLHPKEASLAAELLLEGVCDKIKQGLIVDLGPLGTLYPSVNSKWKTDPEELLLSEMKPKVNYQPSPDIEGAVRGATLGWATEKEESDDTNTPSDPSDVEGGDGGDDTGSGDNDGGDNPPSGDLEEG